MRIGRFILASTIATVSALLVSSAAYAQKEVTLKHKNVFAATFENQECDGPFEDLEPNEDGWHFVLPDSVGDDFTTMTITFSGGVTAGPITAISPATNSGPGWVGFLDTTGSGDVKHAYVITTPAGLELLSGTALVEPDDGATEDVFNLSHTCPGTPATTTPRPTTPAPSGGAETGGGGSYTTAVLGLGALALAGGAGVILFRIRRRDELA